MKAIIDQISYNKLTLEFILFISFNGNQHRIPIEIDTAISLLYHDKIIQPERHYYIESTSSESDFIYYVFKINS